MDGRSFDTGCMTTMMLPAAQAPSLIHGYGLEFRRDRDADAGNEAVRRGRSRLFGEDPGPGRRLVRGSARGHAWSRSSGRQGRGNPHWRSALPGCCVRTAAVFGGAVRAEARHGPRRMRWMRGRQMRPVRCRRARISSMSGSRPSGRSWRAPRRASGSVVGDRLRARGPDHRLASPTSPTRERRDVERRGADRGSVRAPLPSRWFGGALVERTVIDRRPSDADRTGGYRATASQRRRAFAVAGSRRVWHWPPPTARP